MPDKDYDAMLNSIQNLLQHSGDVPLEVEDEKLNNAIASQNRDQDVEYDKRNSLYTDLLQNYIQVYYKKEKAKSKYKALFFAATIILFCGIVITSLICIFMLSVEGNGSLANVGIAISNVAGIVGTLIILPKIIAEHLFPVDEESNMIGMVKNMQDNDAKIRDILFGEHDDPEQKN